MADYKHVVVIGVDGAGAFFREANTPNIDRIFEKGAKTYKMRSTTPTSSCPCWMSCLHGVLPEHHGIIENYFVEKFPFPESAKRYPSFLKLAKEAFPDKDAAAIYNWIGINGIVEDDAGITKLKLHDGPITDYVVNEYLDNNDPSVLYIHYGSTDSKGHLEGYGSKAHLEQITLIDGFIGRIFDKLGELSMLDDTLFIVTTDHGGTSERRHGGLSDEEKLVMFAARGATVSPCSEILDMHLHDTAAVVLYALGIDIPEVYTSRVPSGLFEGVTAKERTKYYDERYQRGAPSRPTKDIYSFMSKEKLPKLIHYADFDASYAPCDAYLDVHEAEGYFGRAVNLDDGYLVLRDFDPGIKSFTVSMYIKTPFCFMDSPLFANKPSEDFTEVPANEQTDGFLMSFIRNTYVGPPVHSSRLDLALMGRTYALEAPLPDGFQHGWVHIALVIDRESGYASIYHDFKCVAKAFMWPLRKEVSIGMPGLTIAEDSTGVYRFKFGVTVDELAVFDGALTDTDFGKLSDYYTK